MIDQEASSGARRACASPEVSALRVVILRARDGELLAGGSWCCVRLGSFHHLFEPEGLPANSIGSKGGRSLYVAEVIALFDHVIESAKIGLRKPDPRIYSMQPRRSHVDRRRAHVSCRISRRQGIAVALRTLGEPMITDLNLAGVYVAPFVPIAIASALITLVLLRVAVQTWQDLRGIGKAPAALFCLVREANINNGSLPATELMPEL